MSTRTQRFRGYLTEYLVPMLQDHDWLIHGDDTLLKIRDEMLLGLYFGVLPYMHTGFTLTVFLRPLYWPFPAFGFGISERIDGWSRELTGLFDFGETDESCLAAASTVAEPINRYIQPLFARLTDSAAVLRHHRTAPWDPLLGWARMLSGRMDNPSPILGYIAAWAGARGQARCRLLMEFRYQRHRPGEQAERYQEHIRRTLSLLSRPAELHSFLEETAKTVRSELHLDRARPLSKLTSPRAGQPSAAP